MKKIVVWCRCSTDSQEIESQILETTQYAISLGYDEKNIITIATKGASAVKLNKLYLDDLNKLFTLIEEEKVEAVVCFHLNRLARNEEVAMRIKNKLIHHKVQLYVKEPNIKLLNEQKEIDAGAELVFSIFATMSKQNAEEMKAKFSRAKRYNRSLGKYIGGVVKYGYRVNEDKFFVIDEKAGTAIKIAFDLYSTGEYSIQSIVNELTLKGYNITKSALSKALGDYAYCNGDIYPPITTKEVVDKCKEIKKTKFKLDNFKKFNLNFCTGLVKCPICSKAYGVRNHYYSCIYQHQTPQFEDKTLNGIAWLIASNEETLQQIYNTDKKKEELKDDIKKLKEHLNIIENTKDNTDEKLDRLTDLYINGTLTKEAFNAKKDNILKEKQQRDNKIQELKLTLNNKQQLLENQTDTSKFLQEVQTSDNINTLQIQEMKKIIQKHIKEITIETEQTNSNRILTFHLHNRQIKVLYKYGKVLNHQTKLMTTDYKRLAYSTIQIKLNMKEEKATLIKENILKNPKDLTTTLKLLSK